MTRRRGKRSTPGRQRAPVRAERQPRPGWLRLDVLVAVLVTVLAIALLGVFLTHASALWRDEVSSVHTQQAPTFVEMWRRAEFESFPLLWMLLLRGWLAIGGGATDETLRIFGLIGPAALIAGVWLAAVRLGRAAPIVSLALIVINPEVLRWSATLRPWGLGAGLALATAVVMWDAVRTPTQGRVIAAGIVAFLSVHCLFQNSVFLAAAAAGCAAVSIRQRTWGLLLIPAGIGLVCALSLLPYAGIIQRRSDWNALGMAPITIGELASLLSTVLQAPGAVAWLTWLVLILAALIAVPLAWKRVGDPEIDQRRDLAVFAGVTIVVAVIGIFALYRQLGYPTQSWYYLGLIALTAACAEVAVRSVSPTRIVQPVLAVTTAVLVLAGAGNAWTAMHERQTNVDVIGARLSAEAGPNDFILASPWYLGVTLSRYYRGPTRVMTLPPVADQSISRYDLLKQQMLEPDPVAPLRLAIEKALSTGHRVWVAGWLVMAPRDATVPASMPRPPLPDTGWNSVPYEVSWSTQVAHLLRSRAGKCSPIDLGVRGGELEHASLIVCRGWR